MLRHASTLHKAPLLRTTRPPYSHRIKHASSSSKPQQQAQKEPSTILSYIRHGITYGLGVLLITHITFTHILEYNPCYGISMLPTFNSFGDWVLISKYYRRGRGIAVGGIVSYAHPHEPYERAIKRVMGLPGDVVMRDTPGVGTGKGMMVQVPEGHVWVVGDNLGFSRDSRMFGPLPMALIKGKVVGRFCPWWWPRRLEDGLMDAKAGDYDND